MTISCFSMNGFVIACRGRTMKPVRLRQHGLLFIMRKDKITRFFFYRKSISQRMNAQLRNKSPLTFCSRDKIHLSPETKIDDNLSKNYIKNLIIISCFESFNFYIRSKIYNLLNR